jgi:hypothetical protein
MLSDDELLDRAERVAQAANGAAVAMMANDARGAALDKAPFPISLHLVQNSAKSKPFEGAEGGYFVVMAVEEKGQVIGVTYAATVALIDPLGRICFRGMRGSSLDAAVRDNFPEKNYRTIKNSTRVPVGVLPVGSSGRLVVLD